MEKYLQLAFYTTKFLYCLHADVRVHVEMELEHDKASRMKISVENYVMKLFRNHANWSHAPLTANGVIGVHVMLHVVTE